MAKTRNNIIADLVSRIRRNVEQADTSVGSALRDIIIDPASTSLAEAYQRLEDVGLAQSPLTAMNEDLVSLAEIFQIYRRSANQATGTIRFYRSSIPTEPITISLGQTVATRATATNPSVSFTTQSAATMPAGTDSWNGDTGRYEVSVPIRAVQGGISGNKPAHTIIVMSSPITGIEGCYNAIETTGGTDKESFAALRSRLLQVLQGNNLGTTSGYSLSVSNMENVEEAITLSYSDSDALRTDVGAVDIVIKGTVATLHSDVYSTSAIGLYPDFIFTKQPWVYSLDEGSVVVTSSTRGVLERDVDYVVAKDTGVYGGSIYGNDAIEWLAAVDNTYGALTIEYQYNRLIEDIQNSFEDDDAKILGADILIKDSIPIGIDVTVSVSISIGYDSVDVSVAVETEIASFINTLSIGETVSQANMVAAILALSGVDDVYVPFTTFESSDGTIGHDANNNIPIPALYRAVSGTIVVNT